MSTTVDVKALLEELKASPFEEVRITTPHVGVLDFPDQKIGSQVSGPKGTWGEKPGTLLANLHREGVAKPVRAFQDGLLEWAARDMAGSFVQAGTHIATIRHILTRDEVMQFILQKALYVFTAPEKAKYYFIPDIDAKIKNQNCQAVKLKDGMEVFIVSRMKRESSLNYSGPEGIIYSIYFHPNENVDAGSPLIGVCPQERLPLIQEVVSRVQSEWNEQEILAGVATISS